LSGRSLSPSSGDSDSRDPGLFRLGGSRDYSPSEKPPGGYNDLTMTAGQAPGAPATAVQETAAVSAGTRHPSGRRRTRLLMRALEAREQSAVLAEQYAELMDSLAGAEAKLHAARKTAARRRARKT